MLEVILVQCWGRKSYFAFLLLVHSICQLITCLDDSLQVFLFYFLLYIISVLYVDLFWVCLWILLLHLILPTYVQDPRNESQKNRCILNMNIFPCLCYHSFHTIILNNWFFLLPSLYFSNLSCSILIWVASCGIYHM